MTSFSAASSSQGGLQGCLVHQKTPHPPKTTPQGPRHRATVGSYRGGRFLMSEEPMYADRGEPASPAALPALLPTRNVAVGCVVDAKRCGGVCW